jgi:ketosteroid isomerase-like protein
MSEENVNVIRSLYDAFAKGDVPSVMNNLDKKIEWNEAENFIYADRNPYIGPQAILEGVFMRLGTQWHKFTVTPERILDVGDTIVVLGTYSGSYLRTGKKVKAQMVHVWELSDGKAVKFQQYTDTKQFAEAVAQS